MCSGKYRIDAGHRGSERPCKVLARAQNITILIMTAKAQDEILSRDFVAIGDRDGRIGEPVRVGIETFD